MRINIAGETASNSTLYSHEEDYHRLLESKNFYYIKLVEKKNKMNAGIAFKSSIIEDFIGATIEKPGNFLYGYTAFGPNFPHLSIMYIGTFQQ